ncbi:MAG: zinc-binding dehydrogenase [Candidatus Rokuibacteriota bacterium]
MKAIVFAERGGPDVLTTFPLAEAADAHRYLESRQSMGELLLIP